MFAPNKMEASTLIKTALFIALSPGVLITLSRRVNLVTVLIHALIFGGILLFLKPYIQENFQSGTPTLMGKIFSLDPPETTLGRVGFGIGGVFSILIGVVLGYMTLATLSQSSYGGTSISNISVQTDMQVSMGIGAILFLGIGIFFVYRAA